MRGRVQGVGFRWFVQQMAEQLGLGGWVRNRLDGTVELEAQGRPEAVSRLIQALQKGPPSAYVSQVVESDCPPLPTPEDQFGVRFS